VQIVCVWSSWCHCHPQIPSSLASFKSRLILPTWYWLTHFVLEKRSLNGCGSVVVVVWYTTYYHCYCYSRYYWFCYHAFTHPVDGAEDILFFICQSISASSLLRGHSCFHDLPPQSVHACICMCICAWQGRGIFQLACHRFVFLCVCAVDF